MKKFYSFIVMLIIASSVVAQNEIEVTKFLGIPVDGTKPAMIQKLKDKGYSYNATYDRLEGEFNGKEVYIHVVTNNNKVYRIMVQDAVYCSEGEIKIRFNRLCQQFEKNTKYIHYGDYSISDDERIRYEISLHNKRYQAEYYQMTDDAVTLTQKLQNYISDKYGVSDLSQLSQDIANEAMIDALMFTSTLYEDNLVWFMIDNSYGKYGILMYYDNKRNQANGEDL